MIGRPIIRLDAVRSTQDVLFRLGERGAREDVAPNWRRADWSSADLLPQPAAAPQRSALTASTTASAVMPKKAYRCSAGAEAPNVSMPTTAPSRPTYLRQ